MKLMSVLCSRHFRLYTKLLTLILRVTKPGSSALLVLLSPLVPLFEGLIAHLGPLPSTSSWGCFCRGILLSRSGTCTALRVSF